MLRGACSMAVMTGLVLGGFVASSPADTITVCPDDHAISLIQLLPRNRR